MAGWTDYVTNGVFAKEPINSTWPALVNALKERLYIKLAIDESIDQADLDYFDPDIRPTAEILQAFNDWCWFGLPANSTSAGYVFFDTSEESSDPNEPRGFLDPLVTGYSTTDYLVSIVGVMEDWKYCTGRWANQMYQLLNLYTCYRTGTSALLSGYTASKVKNGTSDIEEDQPLWYVGVDGYRNHPYYPMQSYTLIANIYEAFYIADIWGPCNYNLSVAPFTIDSNYNYLTADFQLIFKTQKQNPGDQYQTINGSIENKYSLWLDNYININSSYNFPVLSHAISLIGNSFVEPTPTRPVTCTVKRTESCHNYYNNISFKYHS